MTILSEFIYRFSAIPIKMQDVLLRNRSHNSKVCVKPQKTPNTQSDPEKKEHSQSYPSSRFQTILHSHSNKSSMILAQKNRYINQWSRIKNPELNSSIYSQLMFDQEAKNIQQGKGSLFNKWCCENWINTCRTTKLTPISHCSRQSTQNRSKT